MRKLYYLLFLAGCVLLLFIGGYAENALAKLAARTFQPQDFPKILIYLTYGSLPLFDQLFVTKQGLKNVRVYRFGASLLLLSIVFIPYFSFPFAFNQSAAVCLSGYFLSAGIFQVKQR